MKRCLKQEKTCPTKGHAFIEETRNIPIGNLITSFHPLPMIKFHFVSSVKSFGAPSGADDTYYLPAWKKQVCLYMI